MRWKILYVYNIHGDSCQTVTSTRLARCDAIVYFETRGSRNRSLGRKRFNDWTCLFSLLFSSSNEISRFLRLAFQNYGNVNLFHFVFFSRINEFNDARRMNEKFPVLACIENAWQVWVEIEKIKNDICMYFELGFCLEGKLLY